MIHQTFAPGALRLQHTSDAALAPTEFRNFYYEWKKTAPANDSDVIPDKPKVPERPRHAGLCADLKSMLAWKALYESPDPLQTNYLQHPNDEVIDDDDLDEDKGTVGIERDIERALKDGPTAEAMIKAVDGVVFKTRYDTIICNGSTSQRERLVPDMDAQENREPVINYRREGKKHKLPRVELGRPYESEVFGPGLRPIVRLHHVKISDAEHNELRPRGSVISWSWFDSEKDKKPKRRGGDRFASPPPGKILTPEELLIEKERRLAANDNLAPQHAAVLETAISSPNFDTVGTSFGFVGKAAERQGKRLTTSASKQFSAVLQHLAA